MIAKKVPRFLYGWLEFEVKTNNLQDFLNKCLKDNINVYNLSFTDTGAKLSISVYDYKKLQKSKKYRERRKILKKHGLRFFSHRYRKRIGLVLGCILMIFAMIILSGYIWNIDVSGNNRLSNSLILETLEENGVYIGAKKSKLNIRNIKRNIIEDLYDVAWITINLDGSFAHIEIKERDVKPISKDKSLPSNLVASDDGEIVKMEITKGKPIATVGSGVRKGDLLVAGFYNDKKDNLILEHSEGRVTARLNTSKNFSINKKIQKTIGYEKKTYYSINFVNNKLNLYFGKMPAGDEWSKNIVENDVTILGLKLPFTTKQTILTKELTTDYILDEDAAKSRLLDEIDHFEHDNLYECKILKKDIVWKMDDKDKYSCIIDYVIEKNIAVQQYIETDIQK